MRSLGSDRHSFSARSGFVDAAACLLGLIPLFPEPAAARLEASFRAPMASSGRDSGVSATSTEVVEQCSRSPWDGVSGRARGDRLRLAQEPCSVCGSAGRSGYSGRGIGTGRCRLFWFDPSVSWATHAYSDRSAGPESSRSVPGSGATVACSPLARQVTPTCSRLFSRCIDPSTRRNGHSGV